MIMGLGFTGTQKGMTPEQTKSLEEEFARIINFRHEVCLHHGDCVGADEQAHKLFHDLAVRMQFPCKVVVHPPLDPKKRAWTNKNLRLAQVPTSYRPTYAYMIRNAHIVSETELLIAAPQTSIEVQRSGTWSTVRKALNSGKPVTIIWPDGTIKRHSGWS